jgi:hypothetical protein
MRTITVFLFATVLWAVLPSMARAGTPSIPSVTTSTAWTPQQPISVSVSVPAPAAPGPQFVPFSTSAPYANSVLCAGNVVTGFALDYCGSILPVSSVLPGLVPATNNSTPAVTITAATSVCWTGFVVGVLNGLSETPSAISGCGNASYTLTLRTGDLLGAAISTSGSGTVTLALNCGGTPISSSGGSPSDSCIVL